MFVFFFFVIFRVDAEGLLLYVCCCCCHRCCCGEAANPNFFFVLLCNVGMCFERGFYITSEIGYKGHCFTLAVEYKTLSINVQCSFFLHLISLFCFFWPLKMFSKRFHVAILFSEFNFVLLYCATLEHIVYYSQPTKPRMYSKKKYFLSP